jgi:hypothetical protein
MSDYNFKILGCVPPPEEAGGDDGYSDTSGASSFNRGSVIFRLCPPNKACVNNTLDGCSNPLGDYVMDMYDFLEYWTYVIETPTRRRCLDIRDNQCGPSCSDEEENSDDDSFDANFCMFACYNDADAASCYFDFIYEVSWFSNATMCAQPTALEESGYYVGPYCSSGHNFYLGMYTDDECTTFVNDVDKGQGAYRRITGENLYLSEQTKESLGFALPCLTCSTLEINDDDDDMQLCETLYQEAGKCEVELSNSSSGDTSDSGADDVKDVIYTDACPYLETIVPQLATARSCRFYCGWWDDTVSVFLVLGSIIVICGKCVEAMNLLRPGSQRNQKGINIPGGDRPLQLAAVEPVHAGPITHVRNGFFA